MFKHARKTDLKNKEGETPDTDIYLCEEAVEAS